ncbi:hypothetical protein O181_039243, partial [Austropuccinia psidii MF-1]|nr:hypothetical protein [Austropuccinia psidii MF-1]
MYGGGLGCGIQNGFIGEARICPEVEGIGEGGGIEDGSEDRTGWKFFEVLGI